MKSGTVTNVCTLALALLTPLAVRAQTAQSPSCRSLRETSAHPRWLMLPMSRLVVSPTYPASPILLPPAVGDVLPTDLAYYVGVAPLRLPAFLCWHLSEDNMTRPAQTVSLTQADWRTGAATTDFADGRVRLASTGPYGNISRKVTVDLDRTPALRVQIPAAKGQWAIKVSDGARGATLIPDTGQTGETLVDVAAKTGWRGVKTFTLEVWAIGGPERDVSVASLQFLPFAPGPRQYVWDPHQQIARASARDGSIAVETTTGLPDENTVAQRLRVLKAGTGRLRLTGQWTDGKMEWDSARRTLRLQGAGCHAVLAFSRPVRGPSVRARPGAWSAEFSGLKPGDQIVVTARFAPAPGGVGQAEASPTAFAAALKRQEAAWNTRLAAVPRPLDFAPRAVDAKGITANDVRRSYYRAWAFVYADTLPPMPENGYAYPQVCAGKPSLWTYGGTHTEETALWDSSVAMQALALVKPQETWAAAQGVLSEVDSDGYLRGEALPTIFARTLWLLYQQTGDRDKLRDLYPALKRFLVWKTNNPRWIFPNRTKPAPAPGAYKDQEFVVHEIMDMGYAIKIAQALGRPDEAAFWRQEQQTAMADYRHWFWPAPGRTVYRIYASDTKRSDPDDSWSLQGLALGPSLLTPQSAAALTALYQKAKNPALPFLVPGRTRFGDLEPIALGLFECGQTDEAAQLTDACLRDVTRAGEFSEDYTQANPPVPNGVRPSAFGAGLMMDSAFWHNGLMLDQGLPVLLGMPGAAGADNIPVHGDPLSVRFNNATHTVSLAGPGLTRLRLPDGFRSEKDAHGQTRWTGPIAPGGQIRLEAR